MGFGCAHMKPNVPPLPNFSYFHDFFRSKHGTPEGDMRKAYFMAYDEEQCTYLLLPECEEAVAQKKEIVSASFVTPYPPGFPVLVPGQVITADILAFMRALSIVEIHGYRKELGFRVFKESVCGPSEKAAVQKKKKQQLETEGQMPAPAAQGDTGQN